MSEKFGLDWREYESHRINDLIAVHRAMNKRDEKEAKKNQFKK